MKCQILFSGKNKKNIKLSFAELAQRVVMVKGKQLSQNCFVFVLKRGLLQNSL